MTISAADRAYLSVDWRWEQQSDSGLRSRHPGAREADYGSAFMTVGGAAVALTVISALTLGQQRLVVATVDDVPAKDFRFRPPTVRLFLDSRYGISAGGDLFMVEQMNIAYGARRTTLQMIG